LDELDSDNAAGQEVRYLSPAQSNSSLTHDKYAIATHLFVAQAFQYTSASQQVDPEVLQYCESDPIPLAWIGYDWLARSLAG
jgi:hypothetical protein